MLHDQDIGDRINLKQRQVFDFLYDWAKLLIKFKSMRPTCQQQQFYLFFLGDKGCGKLHSIEIIFH